MNRSYHCNSARCAAQSRAAIIPVTLKTGLTQILVKGVVIAGSIHIASLAVAHADVKPLDPYRYHGQYDETPYCVKAEGSQKGSLVCLNIDAWMFARDASCGGVNIARDAAQMCEIIKRQLKDAIEQRDKVILSNPEGWSIFPTKGACESQDKSNPDENIRRILLNCDKNSGK